MGSVTRLKKWPKPILRGEAAAPASAPAVEETSAVQHAEGAVEAVDGGKKKGKKK